LTGTVIISTAPSSSDMVLAAYTRSSVAGLTPVANNDDYNGNLTGQISFVATGGTVVPDCNRRL